MNPSDAVAEYQVAQILATQERKSDAAEHFERAAELRPDFPEALIAVAKLRWIDRWVDPLPAEEV